MISEKEELEIYRDLLIRLHTYRWTGNIQKLTELLDKIGAYSYARTNSNYGNDESEERMQENTLLKLKFDTEK